MPLSGADPGFQVRGGGAYLKNLRRAEGGAKNFGVFRVKNHDFTPKNHILSNFRQRLKIIIIQTQTKRSVYSNIKLFVRMDIILRIFTVTLILFSIYISGIVPNIY